MLKVSKFCLMLYLIIIKCYPSWYKRTEVDRLKGCKVLTCSLTSVSYTVNELLFVCEKFLVENHETMSSQIKVGLYI